VVRQTPVYYYSSASGLVRSFAERLGRPVFNLAEREHRLSEADGPWVLLTPSYKTGNDSNDTIPEGVRRFLRSAHNRRLMVGVMGSGNRNFGRHYQMAARMIAARSGRPMLFEFELAGTPWDVEECRRILAELDEALAAAPREEAPPTTGPAPAPVPAPAPAPAGSSESTGAK
jgi:protein involved in ribonucleotide reduction